MTSWRAIVSLSISIAVALTAAEFVVGSHRTPPVMDWAVLSRVFSAAAASIAALCLAAVLLARIVARPTGLTRVQSIAAGAAAASIWAVGCMLTIGGWTAVALTPFAVPVMLMVVSPTARGVPERWVEAALRLVPAAALFACWLIAMQNYHRSDTPGGRSLAVIALASLAGGGMLFFVGRKFPSALKAAVLAIFLFTVASPFAYEVRPNLDEPSAVLGSRESTPVILLTVDTLRRDALSLYGSSTPTPAIDALGADGIVFDRAYSTAPWTYVSFTGIHSGLTPWGHGVRELADSVRPLASAIATTLGDNGYSTAAIGDNGFLSSIGPASSITDAFGGQFFYPRQVRPPTLGQTLVEKLAPAALGSNASTPELGSFAEEWVRRRADEPFLLWLHFYDPHHPFDLRPEYPPNTGPPAETGPISGDTLHLELHGGARVAGLAEWARSLYQSEVRMVDRSVGSFVQTLKDEGVYDKALIIFTSDHGEEFGEHNGFGHGHTLYDELVRVPLIVKLPHGEAGSRSSQVVSTTAVLPTILDVADIPHDDELYTSPSLLSTRTESDPEPAAFMTGVYRRGNRAEAVVWENYKYIRWLTADHEELYDIIADPGELYNLAGRMPEQAAVGSALIADHAAKEAQRAAARGFEAATQAPLTPDQENLLRGLGYLQ